MQSGELGETDTARREQFSAQVTSDGYLTMSETLALFPDTKDPQNSLRVFRKKIALAAESLEGDFQIQVDGKKTAPLEKRRLWSVGTVPEDESTTQFITRANPSQPSYSSENYAEQKATRTQKKLFVSYAHDDHFIVDGFIKSLEGVIKQKK